MVLAASNAEHTEVEPLLPSPGSKVGDRVLVDAAAAPPPATAPAAANAVEKKKLWDVVQPGLATGSDRRVTWRGLSLAAGGAPITAATLVGAKVA